MVELNDKSLEQVDGGFYGPSEIKEEVIRDTDLATSNDGIYIPTDPMNS